MRLERKAMRQLEEERSWRCEACPTLLEEGQKRLCRCCEAYYADVAAVPFEEEE